ncbi:hypothetical protein AOL_s00097g421 [Orbilia oligospora ATCC 24927]|uniref:Uncharacterized protein n=1 Tax=Arthrobotrys oligospora (strain ATCC 24927 / CBS 115.81 / DSM 1491) TaxID=756982 RepID=G1XJ94_ARTOA|nr:hypothetical protein AOL_s00097g421 [Orbilia oligospora ATCC 24927]EGX46791.1 hypothetical protein AOL_s00097g421 [Orbilia oligospora ATCC 24927]
MTPITTPATAPPEKLLPELGGFGVTTGEVIIAPSEVEVPLAVVVEVKISVLLVFGGPEIDIDDVTLELRAEVDVINDELFGGSVPGGLVVMVSVPPLPRLLVNPGLADVVVTVKISVSVVVLREAILFFAIGQHELRDKNTGWL